MNISSRDFKSFLKQSAAYLERSQDINGGFDSFSSPDPNLFAKPKKYITTFLTALILMVLADVKDKTFDSVKKKAAEFLLREKTDSYTFNYWSRYSPEYKATPYPEDLDDTFCALIALAKYNKRIISGKVLGNIVAVLTQQEKEPGGPYRTWLVPESSPKEWTDVDLAVNCNIAHFLSLFDTSLEKLNQYIEYKIIKDEINSPYYPDFYPIIYYLSNFYTGRLKNDLVDFLLKKIHTDQSWGNELHSALAIISLIHFGAFDKVPERAIASLLSTKKYQARAFCVDPSINGTTYYAGAPSLTAAFIAAAIYKYRLASSSSRKESFPPIYSEIKTSVLTEVKPGNTAYKREIIRFSESLLSKDHSGEILLMPYFFAREFKLAIGQQKLKNLCKGSYYGWVAYTIYDKILDGEAVPRLLPAANYALRKLVDLYTNSNLSTQSIKIFHTTMNQIDSANLWETLHCQVRDDKDLVYISKIPNYTDYLNLSHKSLGHALGPLVILSELERPKTETAKYRKILQYYLVIKQLNDDAHDWEEDLMQNKINPVTALMARSLRLKIVKKNDLSSLKEHFWDKTIIEIANVIIKYADEAERLSKTLGGGRGDFSKLICLQRQGAIKALEEREKILGLIEFYR